MVSMPALLTSTSIGPSSFQTLSNMASTSDRRPTSAFTVMARRPLLRTQAATSSALSALTA